MEIILALRSEEHSDFVSVAFLLSQQMLANATTEIQQVKLISFWQKLNKDHPCRPLGNPDACLGYGKDQKVQIVKILFGLLS